MNTKRTIVFLLAIVLFMTTTTSFAQSAEKLPPIKYQEFTLPNDVIKTVFRRDLSKSGCRFLLVLERENFFLVNK